VRVKVLLIVGDGAGNLLGGQNFWPSTVQGSDALKTAVLPCISMIAS
jgi:hypothetical protein